MPKAYVADVRFDQERLPAFGRPRGQPALVDGELVCGTTSATAPEADNRLGLVQHGSKCGRAVTEQGENNQRDNPECGELPTAVLVGE